ncbi:MAG TPA: MFS transporter, partial [Bryobacteraceae bacterium]|nr:MFS transporter [Bryobacteraceae bacterium]
RAVIVLGMLLVRTRGMVWLAFPLLLVETVMAAFFEPARNAVIPNITSESGLLVANTLSSVTWSFNLAIGATLGGLAAVLLGRGLVFALNSFSFLASAWLISGMQFRESHLAAAPPLRGRDLADFSPVLEGVRYMRGNPRLFATVFVKAGLGFMGANNVILPLLGERVFPVRLAGMEPHRGAMLGMSLLMGARGVGALLGPFVSGVWAGARQSRLRTGILAGFLMASAGYVAVGFCGSAAPAIAAVILAHCGGSTVWVFSTTLLQRYTEDRYRGRVFSAELGLCMLTISASSYLAGAAVDLGVPVQRFAIGMGLSMLLPAAIWLFALRHDP